MAVALDPTEFHFNFYGSHPDKLKPVGDAYYPNQSPVLRLTKTDDNENPQQWSIGRGNYSKPVAFGLGDQIVNFKTEVQFTVTVLENTPYADGLVFFIVPEGHKYPTAHGGNLGIFEPPAQSPGPRVFAVAFDIYSQNPGYIKLGICIRSRTPKSFIPVPVSFLGTKLTLKVSYDSDSKYIDASVSDGNVTFPTSYKYDLSDILPPKVELGLASTTGQYVAVHDVHSWDFISSAGPL